MLGLHPSLAPIKAGVFPLVKKDGMPEFATRLAADLRARLSGLLRRIGVDRPALSAAGRSRDAVLHYRRWPDRGRWTVTVRERDTLKQDRVSATALGGYIADRMRQ